MTHNTPVTTSNQAKHPSNHPEYLSNQPEHPSIIVVIGEMSKHWGRVSALQPGLEGHDLKWIIQKPLRDKQQELPLKFADWFSDTQDESVVAGRWEESTKALEDRE